MKNTRPTMANIWMQTAINISKRSKCSKAQVGCVITTNDMRHVLGNGYNGGPAKIKYICIPETCSCLHAENNAVIDCGSQFKNKVFFVTMFPCKSCAIQIINSGCSKLYYHTTYKTGSKHWINYKEIIYLLSKSKIKIKRI